MSLKNPKTLRKCKEILQLQMPELQWFSYKKTLKGTLRPETIIGN